VIIAEALTVSAYINILVSYIPNYIGMYIYLSIGESLVGFGQRVNCNAYFCFLSATSYICCSMFILAASEVNDFSERG